jgi:hypothetical protein
MSPKSADSGYAGKHAALLSLVEIGLGSVLHGLRVPLSGHFLSCNQGFLLCRATRLAPPEEKNRLMGATISNVAAILKSLSPAGKRLTPMLAISSQGLLFSLGTLLLGANYFGCLLGIMLLSLWAFAQPLLIAYFMFGSLLFEGFQKLFKSIEQAVPSLSWENFIAILSGIVGIKILVSSLLCTLAFVSLDKSEKYFFKIQQIGQKNFYNQKSQKRRNHPLVFIFQPLFLLSLGITLFFFIYSEREKSELIWILLRPLAAGLILYYLALYFPIEKFLVKTSGQTKSNFFKALGYSINILRNKKK